jgi:NADP-dependent 3-hydroxy acid dehydrogenase YdfG
MEAKTILITGASSGIGKATGKLFHEKGWNVVATMRTPEKETELTQLDNVLVTRLDVLDEASIQSAIEAAISRFGKIDALLNNAGYGAYGPLEAFPMNKIRRQFETNVIGLLAVTKAVLPHMRAQKSGVVANVSSIGGKIAFPLGTLYHGTKFAVEGLSEALQYELGANGINVKIIEPGMIQTDFAGRSFDFVNDESIRDYQPIVKTVVEGFGPAAANASPARDCAEVIWAAVTDGTNKLRYPAAGGAEDYFAGRAAADDEAFFDGVKQQFGL